jgi:hypothetical protein
MWPAPEPANQQSRVRAAKDSSLADACELDGRVEPAHGEVKAFNFPLMARAS